MQKEWSVVGARVETLVQLYRGSLPYVITSCVRSFQSVRYASVRFVCLLARWQRLESFSISVFTF